MTLTAKQENFCQAIASGMNQSDAYRSAYDAGNMKPETVQSKACLLMAEGKVKNRVTLLKQALIETWLAKKAETLDDWFFKDQAKKCMTDDVDGKTSSKIKKTTRYSVFLRAGFKCQCCGAKPTQTNDVVLHIDHVIPRSIGGTNDIINLQSLCSECNQSKTNAFAYDHNQEVDLWAN